jgi:hypothetical protein
MMLAAGCTAARHWVRRTVRAATSSATSADEHAVSMRKLAPFRPRTYEMRAAGIDAEMPVAVYGFTS